MWGLGALRPSGGWRQTESGDGNEAGQRVVQSPDEPGGGDEGLVGVARAGIAREVGEDLAALLVYAEHPRCAFEPHLLEVPEEAVHRRRPAADRTTHGVPDPHHAGGHGAAGECHLAGVVGVLPSAGHAASLT